MCSTRNVEQVRSAGADQVIDYRSEDFTHGDLAESAQPVIERTYPLTDAIRHVELEHARAKVVVTA